MLQVSFIRQHTSTVKEKLAKRNFSNTGIVDTLLDLDEKIRSIKASSENSQATINILSKEIGILMGNGEKENAERKINRMQVIFFIKQVLILPTL